MADKTFTQRQSRRTAQLDQIAHSRGWHSWSVYERNVKNGVVDIARNPEPSKRAVQPKKKATTYLTHKGENYEHRP